MEMWKKQKKTAIAFCVFLSLMFLCTLVSRAVYASRLPQITTKKPERTALIHKVETEGLVSQGMEYAVNTLSGLRCRTVHAHVGDRVTAETLLFEIDMEDLQTINDIINSAVKNSSYITAIISSCVFILYTLIIKVVDLYKSKDRNKPLVEMASAIKEVSENAVKLNQVLDKTIQDAETKEASRITNIILTAFTSFKSAVLDQCIDVIIHNNIEATRDNVKQTIYKTVSTEYYKIYSIFSAYEHDTVNVATKIKEEWIDDITNECLEIIYDGADSVTRIRQLNNKLNLIVEEYSIYIKNKVFNH